MANKAWMRFAANTRAYLSTKTAGDQQACYALFYRLIALTYLQHNRFLPQEFSSLQDAFSFLHETFHAAFSPFEIEYFGLSEKEVTAFFSDALREIPQEDWENRPEIIGWLYQYYHTEDKNAAFAQLKGSGKIAGEQLPAATQLFTPDWVAEYLVQNSLGKLLGLHDPAWRHYLPDVTKTLENPDISLHKLKIIDPCMGSGHLLLQAFDVLMTAYRSKGYSPEEAAALILQNNLFGLDIDPNVAQAANFELLMKAASYAPALLQTPFETNLYAVTSPQLCRKAALPPQLLSLVDVFSDADCAGSLLHLPDLNEDLLQKQVDALQDTSDRLALQRMLTTATLLTQQYDIVLTNPPYMGKKNLDKRLSSYLALYYPDTKSELYAAFLSRCIDLTKPDGYTAMVTVHTWMFLRSFAPLRQKLLRECTVSTLLHSGAGTFEELSAYNVLASAFCLRKRVCGDFISTFVYLGDHSDTASKKAHFQHPQYRYHIRQSRFANIPGMPFVYRISEQALAQFDRAVPLGSIAKPRQGIATSDNKRFVRYWFEVDRNDLCLNAESAKAAAASGKRFFPYNKGGFYRKWYGMNEYVLDWANDGKALKSFDRAVLRNQADQFKSGITWSLFGFENFGVRYKPSGFLFDVSGSSMFPPHELTLYILAFLCSKAAFLYLSVLAPTVNFQVGNIHDLPFLLDEQIKPEIDRLARDCIEIAKADWDDHEMSWDFEAHPLLRYGNGPLLLKRYAAWEQLCSARYQRLKANEERINALFIGLYQLENDITPEVQARDLSVKQANRKQEVRAFLSYAIGCLLGRWGDAYTDRICFSDPYADDGVMTLLQRWLCRMLGEAHLEQNLAFLAKALGGKGEARELLCRYFTRSYYADHLQQYQKHPIYFLLDSGKEHAFTALFSIHRYRPELLADVRAEVLSAAQNELLSVDEREELLSFADRLLHLSEKETVIDTAEGVRECHRKLAAILRPL